jgi:hypothetical protein
VKGFREFFEKLNRSFLSAPSNRKTILAEVIQVAEGTKFLLPVTEVAEVQKMINSHNARFRDPVLNVTKSPYGRLQVKRTVFYTGYLISNNDSSRLITHLVHPLLPPGMGDSNDLKYMANSVLITPRPAPKSILDKVGGIGKKLRWQVTGVAVYDHKIWAARVKPVPETERYYTENPTPIIVLAVRKGARPIDAGRIQNWQPVGPDKALVFDTVVGEKVILRIEEEDPDEGAWESQFVNKNNKRRHHQELHDEDVVYPPGSTRDSGSYYQNNGTESSPYRRPYPQGPRHPGEGSRRYHDDPPRRGGGPSNFRGGRGRGSAGGRGKNGNSGRGGGRGRGRGGGPQGYRSLDDYGGNDGSYDDRGGGGNGGLSLNY